MIANPISINTFVVFVRLYWFEKRFQHIAREARNLRKTRSRSRTITYALHDDLPRKEERGVNGRSIVVLHGGSKLDGETDGSLNEKKPDTEKGGSSLSSSSDTQTRDAISADLLNDSPSPHQVSRRLSFHREITFADELNTPVDFGSLIERIPQQMSAEQQIAFLENQRNPKDKGTLRIPGPLEIERGVIPETLLDEDHGNQSNGQVISPIETHDYLNRATGILEAGDMNGDDHPMKRNITIDDSNHPHWNKMRPSLSNVTFRNTATNRSRQTPLFDRAPSTARVRSRSGTFGSFGRNSADNNGADAMPYLSWQPTIGRNSAFVDLTEEQREELGGIEYRSLKTLAIILVCKLPWDGSPSSFIDN